MQGVDDFIEQILVDKGITDLDPETRSELKDDMKQSLLDQIDEAAIMQLSEEKANEINSKLEDPNFTKNDMVDFMSESGVDLAQVALGTMVMFRKAYLAAEV